MNRNTDQLGTSCVAVIFTLFAFLFWLPEARAYNTIKLCNTNLKCRIVDVLDRGLFNETFFSSVRVTEAWNSLVPGNCSDVADVVVGGTFGEDGAPAKSTPAGFAEHLTNRCTIVVSYELEGPVIDAQAYIDSVEHGRKALAIVLNRLDSIRTSLGKTGKIRVWGHSKGSSIVESTWRMEARNNQTKFITTLNGVSYYVDACPSNNCYYFGFGYPYEQERENSFSISNATASLWTGGTDGYIEKPATANNQWFRLTTFSNLSDPIYECSLGCLWDLLFFSRCHRYEQFLHDMGYSFFDDWNAYSSTSTRPTPKNIGDAGCGELGSTGTFQLSPDNVSVSPRDHIVFHLAWTVPEGGWRRLKEIHFTLADDDGVVLWVRFDEATNTASLFRVKNERFGRGEILGGNAVLENSMAKLHLQGSRAHASGPTDPTVILDLEVGFKSSVEGRELRVEVSANDDLGDESTFQQAGTVFVARE